MRAWNKMGDQVSERTEAEGRYNTRKQAIDEMKLSETQKSQLNACVEARYHVELLQLNLKTIGSDPFYQGTYTRATGTELPNLARDLDTAKDVIVTHGGNWKVKGQGCLERELDGSVQFGGNISLSEETRSLAEKL